jgi:hypothetical protein
MRRLGVILLLGLGLRLEGAVAVVDSGVPVGELTRERARDLLLGRVTTWPNGEAVVIVLCANQSGDRAVMGLCGRAVGVLQRSWKRLVFSGTGAMPVMVDTPLAAMDQVRSTRGAITVLEDAVGDLNGLSLIDLDAVAGSPR